MNKTTTGNPCSRCGTQRIVVKTWTEKIGNNMATMEETACPDPACQKEVDLENQKQSDKRRLIKEKNAERIANLKRPAALKTS
jgi:hypothetical protein